MKKLNKQLPLITIQHITHLRIPTRQQFTQWVTTALQRSSKKVEVLIRVVDETEIKELNANFRGKNMPTNILSFPFENFPYDPDNQLLGELIICAPQVKKEAKEQHKTIIAHYAHLTIHGTLHLLGYDHIEESDAKKMETCEIRLLKKLGFANPY